MEQFTAKTVFDQFVLLPNDQQRDFLCMIGSSAVAEVPFLIANELPLPELARFTDMIHKEIGGLLFPMLQQEARRMAREMPQLSDEEFDKLFHERIKENMEIYNREIAELAQAQFKDARDRKSDPETIRRNLELLNLRKQDPKHWSYNALARRFSIPRQSVQKIVKEETKWRRLGASN